MKICLDLLNRGFQIAILITSISLFSGCDFEQPISESASVPVNSKLMGKWESKKDNEIEYIQIEQKDGTHYAGRFWDSEKPEKAESFIAWPTTIDAQTFMTIDLGKQESKRYVYLKFSFDGQSKFSYRSISSDSKFAADKQGSVPERIARHLKDPDFYREETQFTKSK